jgi:class 3 adenylate cyclase/DNA-binding transcriptional MerR regulator
LLTSKEIIERTGISRATLNNYIASGLVPRPQVLPPGPEHGAAPRIGYFPDDTVTRIETIQRLKREGWSIARISEHLSSPSAQPVPEARRIAQHSAVRPVQPAPAPVMPSASRLLLPAPAASGGPGLTLPLALGNQPAYLVDDRLAIVWSNEQARTSALSPLAPAAGLLAGNVLAHLIAAGPAGAAVLRFHLRVARARALPVEQVVAGLTMDDAARVRDLYAQSASARDRLVLHASLPAVGTMPPRQVHAVQFQEGVLFAYLPQEQAEAPALTPAPGTRAVAAPQVTPVAVLVGRLQDAAGLWVKLSAQEYFELVNEVWAELDAIFRRHRARPGRTAGEVLACYFVPQADGSYLWNSLAAAHQTREAMRQLSHRWQLRKGWDVDLCINIGIAEGQEWMGAVGAAGQGELRVLGDAADHAEHLAAASRAGAILVTRNLIGKLGAEERQHLTYGVTHQASGRGDAPLLSTFARLEEIAGAAGVPPHLAGLPVAELLDLTPPTPHPGPSGTGI